MKKYKELIFIVLTVISLSACQGENQTNGAEEDQDQESIAYQMKEENPSNKEDNIETTKQTATQNWLNENSKRIKLESSNFEDLQFLKDVLKDKRIVYLGENSHGVSEFNTLKTRLIKFLHEEMNFEVIAFESGLAETFTVQHIEDDLSPKDKMFISTFSVWHSPPFLSLFEYIEKTQESEQPLTLSGFDIQPQVNAYQKWFENQNGEMLPGLTELIVKTETRLFSPPYIQTRKSEEKRLSLIEQYEKILSLMEQKKDEIKDYEFHHKIIENRLLAMNDYYQSGISTKEKLKIRDKAMAENMKWLVETVYPNKKIIVWGHNDHIRKDSQFLMGEYLYHEFGDRSYVIGLFMNEGTAALNNRKTYEVGSRPKGSLEGIVSQSGYPISFVNFDNVKITQGNEWMLDYIDSFSGQEYKQGIVPSDQYDGVIVIKDVHPPEYLDPKPKSERGSQ